MRRLVCSVMLVIAHSLQGVVAETPDTIVLDGDMSDWPQDSLQTTDSNAVTFRMTWDESHLFIGWSGTDWASESDGADLFIYLNTTEGGTPLSKDWNLAQTLPFAADHAFVLEDSAYSSLQMHDGSAWVENPESATAWVGILRTKTPKLAFHGVPLKSRTRRRNCLGTMARCRQRMDFIPLENPATSNGGEAFTHWYQIENRSTAQSSADVAILTSDTPVEKVDDALNLAISSISINHTTRTN